jgi:hypothetical protein
MSKEKKQKGQASLGDLRDRALKHYDEASSSIHHWNSSIPQAIRYYFDERPKIEKRLKEYASQQQGEVIDFCNELYQAICEGHIQIFSSDEIDGQYYVNKLEELIKPQADKEHNVDRQYTIDEVMRCVEHWGLCKVEKEYIEKFLNEPQTDKEI